MANNTHLPEEEHLLEIRFGEKLEPRRAVSGKVHRIVIKRPVLFLTHTYHDNTPVRGAEFELELENGQVIQGKLNDEGQAEVQALNSRPLRVRYGPDNRPFEIFDDGTNPAYISHFSKEDPAAYLDAVRAGKINSSETTAFAIEAVDWIWGTAKGNFNEKQSVSQIIVDAVIGMIPIVGEVTAARDILATVLGMAHDPKKRESKLEWLSLTVLLLALIPVLGGALKGVGKLLLREVKGAEEAARHVEEIIGFLNHVSFGNARTWFQKIDFEKYSDTVLKLWRALMQRLDGMMEALLTARIKSAVSKYRLEWMKALREKLQTVNELAEQMIPEAIRDLNNRLKSAQRCLYNGEWHEIPKDLVSKTWETEARLVGVPGARKWAVEKMQHPQNTKEMFAKQPDWPNLTDKTNPKYVKVKGKKVTYEVINAFSGPMRAVRIEGGTKIFRVIKDSGEWGSWWSYALPASGREWREGFAVLDSWSSNGRFVELTVPDEGLVAWVGKAAGQVENNPKARETLGQYLAGGHTQLFIDMEFAANMSAIENQAKRLGMEKRELLKRGQTDWVDYMGLHVPEKVSKGDFLAPMELTEKATRRPDESSQEKD